MKINGKDIRPIWLDNDLKTVKIIDQRRLPHEFIVADLKKTDDVIHAIQKMYVRGAPLIGVTAAYGVYLAVLNGNDDGNFGNYLLSECNRLKEARPTAVNLNWAVDEMLRTIINIKDYSRIVQRAREKAKDMCEFEAENCKMIGKHGYSIIQKISENKNGDTVNILTHCNAGWLACIEYGTATAPIYYSSDKGIDVHVWVDETRPLNQGSRLTAWELSNYGVSHTIIVDNTGGHLMQRGDVDLVIVGTDRTTRTGDVANKIGTYLKALAARDNNIPFYVALPSTTFDWQISNGFSDIPIEKRDPDEIHYVYGYENGNIRKVRISPVGSPAANFAFDVTPARLVTGFITERGICQATENDIAHLFPEKFNL